MIILLFCSPKSPACDYGGTELDIFDTQGTLQVGSISNSPGTNSLNMNIVTTPTSMLHSNRV